MRKEIKKQAKKMYKCVNGNIIITLIALEKFYERNGIIIERDREILLFAFEVSLLNDLRLIFKSL